MVHGISVMISVTLLSLVRDADGDVSDAIDSDEDNALKDALLLVDILKSAYVKVLKENGDLRAGSDTTAELSTCPTTRATNTTPIRNVSTIRVPLAQPISSPATRNGISDKHPYNWSPPPFYRSNPRNYRRYPPRYYRRYMNMNMPLDYYYYDLDKLRRFNYEDAFGAHPNDTATKDVGAHKETTSSIGTTVTTTHEVTMPTTSVLPKSYGVSNQTKSISVNKPKKVTQSSGEENQKLKLMLPIPSEDISTPDPVISQVASELINEFGSGRSSFRPKHLKIIKLPNRIVKPGVKDGWWHLNPPKTTLRIHLSRSTKFPIPYPDNHAFCYTNPENALCRTLIK